MAARIRVVGRRGASARCVCERGVRESGGAAEGCGRLARAQRVRGAAHGNWWAGPLGPTISVASRFPYTPPVKNIVVAYRILAHHWYFGEIPVALYFCGAPPVYFRI